MKLTKEQYDALPDGLKAQYKADGDGYSPTFKTAEEFDTELAGLKSQVESLIGEKREAKSKAEKEAAERQRIADEAAAKNGDVEALRASYDGKLASLQKAFDDYKAGSTKQISDLTVGAAADSLASKLFGKNASIAGHVVRSRLTMEEVDGKPVVRVLDKDGKPSAATIEDLQKEISGNKDYSSVLVTPPSGAVITDKLNDVSKTQQFGGNTMTQRAIELARDA